MRLGEFRAVGPALAALLLAPGCQRTTRPDASTDTAPPVVRIAQIGQPVVACDRVELRLEVHNGQRLDDLEAEAFSFVLTDMQRNRETPRANECSGTGTMGDAVHYRVCFSGLEPGASYLLTTHVETGGDTLQHAFYFATLAECMDAGSDAP